MPEKKLSCYECGKRVANSNNVLARHVRSAHNMEWSDYIVKHEHDGEWPTCLCGCGERLPWRKGGFNLYIKGHDNQGKQNANALDRVDFTIFDKGWVPNPFTGREEHMDTDDEAAFLSHCVSSNDPVTKDHGIKIGWEDNTGRLQILTPNFQHLRQRIIFIFDDFSDAEGGRRLAGIKAWCDEHRFLLLLVSRSANVFDIIGGHKPTGMEVNSVTQASKA